MVNPDIGFTSDVITDSERFVGRTEILRKVIKAINSELSVIAIFGKRGVGKSSLLRQIQKIALGDYSLLKQSGLHHEIPERPRQFLTVYYTCDALIKDGSELITRICNDQNEEDGLVRLVPNDGKDIVEFTRGAADSVGIDLKVIKWGEKGIETSKYAKVIPNDPIQTFRNFVSSIITHQVKGRMKRDGLLILFDEFDVLRDKTGLGSIFKSISSSEVKFGICGIGHDLEDLVTDHASIERLLEQGVIPVMPMTSSEIIHVYHKAEELFKGKITFDDAVKNELSQMSQGYPYLAQLLGRECVNIANELNTKLIDLEILAKLKTGLKNGSLFPTLESAYQRAIGNSKERELLLHLLASQPAEDAEQYSDINRIYVKELRKDALELKIEYIDQLMPRLVDPKFGPVLSRVTERPGIYEFVNPVFRIYCQLRDFAF